MTSLDDYTDSELGRMFRAAIRAEASARRETVTVLDAFCEFLNFAGLGWIAVGVKASAWAWDRVKTIWRSIFR
jgi:hypothetical protein